MKITVTVDSFEELFDLSEKLEKLKLQRDIGIAQIEGTDAPAEASEPKKGKKAGTKQPETVEKEPESGTKAEETGTKAEETGTAPEVDVEKLKVEVRKLLTKVNKQTGKNQAKEWIANLGHDSLTDVEDADDLLALKGLAEEVLNA